MSIIHKDGANKQGLNFQTDVVVPYWQEYKTIGVLSKLMGGKDAAVWGRVLNPTIRPGDTVAYNVYQYYMPDVRTGDNYNTPLITGQDETMCVASDSVSINSFRFDTKVINASKQKQDTGNDFYANLRRDLINKAEKLKEYKVLKALATSFKGNGSDANGSTLDVRETNETLQGWMKDGRFAVLAPADNYKLLSKDRFVFGSKTVGAATDTVGEEIETLFTDAETRDSNNLTVQVLYNLSVLANNGSREAGPSGEYEESIEPHSFKEHNGYRDKKYILFVTSKAYMNLNADPEWRAQTQRGVIESEIQPSILFNTDYKGTVHGISVVVSRDLSRLEWVDTTVVDANATVSYGVLVGAKAFAYAIAGEPEIRAEAYDYGNVEGLCHKEYSGFKVMKFGTKKLYVPGDADFGKNPYPHVEKGMIHLFTVSKA